MRELKDTDICDVDIKAREGRYGMNTSLVLANVPLSLGLRLGEFHGSRLSQGTLLSMVAIMAEGRNRRWVQQLQLLGPDLKWNMTLSVAVKPKPSP